MQLNIDDHELVCFDMQLNIDSHELVVAMAVEMASANDAVDSHELVVAMAAAP